MITTATATAGGWTLRWSMFIVLAILMPLVLRIPGEGDVVDEATFMALMIVVAAAWNIARIVGHAESSSC